MQANGHRLASATAAAWASSWDLPAGTSAVVLSQPGTGGQHLADIAMVLVWAIVLLIALVRLRSRWRAQLTRTNLELSTAAMDVPEMDWASVWEEETVG